MDEANSRTIPIKKRIRFRTNICLLRRITSKWHGRPPVNTAQDVCATLSTKLTSLGRRRHSFYQRRDHGEQQRGRQRDAREDPEGARQDVGSSLLEQLSCSDGYV